MTRKRAGDEPQAKKPETDAEAPAEPTPIQRPASPDEQAQLQAQIAQQRGRAEVAVLKQRFAETDVAMTIAQAERDQLIQQNQLLQQENARLTEELAAATNDEDGQTTPAEAAPESED